MKLIKSIFFGALIASSAAIVYAGNSTELNVTGKITSSACNINFSNGGVLELGIIPASSISMLRPTKLPDVYDQVKIVCDAPSVFVFKITDNRASSKVTNITYDCIGNPCSFGLGAINGTNIGAYYLKLSVVRDEINVGARPVWIVSSGAGASWGTVNSGILTANTWNGIAWSSGSLPKPYESVSAYITATATINTGTELPLVHEIPIDGSATFELIYL